MRRGTKAVRRRRRRRQYYQSGCLVTIIVWLAAIGTAYAIITM